jgi:hypothetical protein
MQVFVTLIVCAARDAGSNANTTALNIAQVNANKARGRGLCGSKQESEKDVFMGMTGNQSLRGQAGPDGLLPKFLLQISLVPTFLFTFGDSLTSARRLAVGAPTRHALDSATAILALSRLSTPFPWANNTTRSSRRSAASLISNVRKPPPRHPPRSRPRNKPAAHSRLF